MHSLQRSLHLFNFNSYVPPIDSSLSQPKRKSYSYQFQRLKILQSSIQGSYETIDKAQKHSTRSKVNACIEVAENSLPHVQTLSKLPKEELRGKVVMVRLDSNVLLLEVLDTRTPSVDRSLTTIKYLHHTGAKVLIASNWGGVGNEVQILSREILADHLSSVLQLKVVPVNWLSGCTQSKKEVLKEKDILLIENLSEFREEISNCSVFSRKLSSGVDIFVNDAFSQTHKILASTVGVPRYCCSSVSGFCFEKELSQVVEITNITEQPYIAVIGGGNIYDKAAALHVLASKCDGLVFVGMMAFQIMHALGLPVPLSFVERSAVEDSFKIVNHARKRNIPILLPKDFWCLNDSVRAEVDIFPADGILNGWSPVDLGPASLDEISFLLSKCKCPNPDFNKPEHRWRMLQRSLVEAIVDLLAVGGKIFLQSDVEAVAMSMRDLFMLYGKGRLAIIHYDDDLKTDNGRWLKENPFGIPSDWERHVLDRGAPMYRLMISKSM